MNGRVGTLPTSISARTRNTANIVKSSQQFANFSRRMRCRKGRRKFVSITARYGKRHPFPMDPTSSWPTPKMVFRSCDGCFAEHGIAASLPPQGLRLRRTQNDLLSASSTLTPVVTRSSRLGLVITWKSLMSTRCPRHPDCLYRQRLRCL